MDYLQIRCIPKGVLKTNDCQSLFPNVYANSVEKTCDQKLKIIMRMGMKAIKRSVTGLRLAI